MKLKEFKPESLYVIEDAINAEINVLDFAKPELTSAEMRYEFLIRLLAKNRNLNHLDVLKYFKLGVLGFGFGQIKEIATGYRLKLDYNLYASLEYDEFQMKEIRIAMQKGENYKLLLNSEMPATNMHTLRMKLKKGNFTERQLMLFEKCKEEGFDVNILANYKYSYSKMKYILTDMRAGRDLEYLNGNYSGKHIDYIRKAMIHGKDPKPLYNDKLHILKVMEIYRTLKPIPKPGK